MQEHEQIGIHSQTTAFLSPVFQPPVWIKDIRVITPYIRVPAIN
jgi:hypothetical protein